MSIASLYRRLNEYQNCKNDVRELISTLKSTLNSLNNTKISLNSMYKYNDTSADNGKLNNICLKLEETINNLENNIIPELNRKITSLKNDIRDAEAEEKLK